MKNSEIKLPEPTPWRMDDTVPWYDVEAPYVSSYAIRVRRAPGYSKLDLCDVIKVQYAIELEKRLRKAVARIEELELQISADSGLGI